MRTHTGARLLLADDDSVTLQACADALVLEGFEVPVTEFFAGLG